MNVKNLVIGAGISGLTFAYMKKGKCLVIDREKEVGGLCRTVYSKNGFTWDFAGHFVHLQTDEVKALLKEVSNRKNLIYIKKNTKIYHKNRLIDFPFQANIHQLKILDFIKALVYYLFSKKRSYKTFKGMLYSRYGAYISDEFLLPYNKKLYCCDLNILSIDAMGRFFPDAGIVKHLIKRLLRVRNSYNDEFLHPRDGVNYYIKCISDKIPQESILTNTEILSINIQKKQAQLSNGTTVKYDNLISSVPFIKLLKLCDIPFDESMYSYSKVLVFNFGFSEECEVDTHWVYYSEKEYIFYRVGYWSNIYDDNRLSIYVEVAFSSDEIVDISKVRKKVLSDLKKAKVVKKGDLIDEHHVLINPAYVHIRDETKEHTRKTIDCLATKHNIYSIGRYGAWKYCSIEDNIVEAMTLSREI